MSNTIFFERESLRESERERVCERESERESEWERGGESEREREGQRNIFKYTHTLKGPNIHTPNILYLAQNLGG